MKPEDRRRYEVPYEESQAHQHLVGLLAGQPERGLVIDLGCGYAGHAEHLQQLGFGYAGLDTNPEAIADLLARGIEASHFDLRQLEGLESALDALRRGRPVVAVTALDVLEHLVEPDRLLARLRDWMSKYEVAYLGISIPNVAHQDLAVKLLAGRWDLTATGLLDATHVRFFTATSLASLFVSSGFVEVADHDVTEVYSDQHWPVEHPAVSAGTPLGAFLRQVRRQFDQHADTYQFIRLYRADPRIAPAPTLLSGVVDDRAPVLSILVDLGPDVTDIPAALATALSAQTAEAIELVVAERLAAALSAGPGPGVVPVAGRDVTGDDLLAAASGAYTVVVDGSSIPSSEWAGALVDAIRRAPGAIVRCQAPAQPVPSGLAFPTAVLRSRQPGSAITPAGLGAIFLALAPLCGTSLVGGDLLRQVADGIGPPHSGVVGDPVWDPQVPTLADRELSEERNALRRRVEELERWSASIVSDNAALNAELRRTPVRVVRRLSSVLRRPVRRHD